MIDWERVHGLREEIGPADFADVVRLFLEEVEEVIARLSRPDATTALEAALHLVKGCALNLGFQRLAELCHAGEHRAAARESALIDLNGIVEGYRESRARFLAGLRGTPGDQIRNSPSNTSSVMSR